MGHLLITENDNLSTTVGVISKRDILVFVIKNFATDSKVDALLDEKLGQLTLGTTGHSVVCARKDDTLRRVLSDIKKHKYSCIPVVDDNQTYIGAINKSHVDLIFRDSCYHLVVKSDPVGQQSF